MLEIKKTIKIARNLLWRDFIAGNYNILIFAILVSITSVISIQFLTNKVEFSIAQDGRASIASDLRITSTRKIDSLFAEKAKFLGIETGRGVQFPSMVSNKTKNSLVSLKAVSDLYPLRGDMKITNGKKSFVSRSSRLEKNEAFVDPAVLTSLDLRIGDFFKLGTQRFKIVGLIEVEPDRGLSFVNFSPRVIINLRDLESTELVQRGSRVNHNLWIASENEKKIYSYKSFFSTNKQLGQTLDTYQSARPEVKEALTRIRSFLALISMLTVILGSVAIAIAANYIMRLHAKTLVTLKVFGASKKLVANIWLFILSTITLGSFICSVILGYCLHLFLVEYLSVFSEVSLPNVEVVNLWQILQILLVTAMLVFIFTWPVFSRVINRSVIQTYQGDSAEIKIGSTQKSLMVKNLILFGSLFVFLFYLVIGDLQLVFIVLISFLTLGLIFLIAVLSVIKFLNIITVNFDRKNLGWTIQSFLRSVVRRKSSISLQTLALGMAISSVVSTSFIERNLSNVWEAVTSDKVPNRFLLNIQSDQIPSLSEELDKFTNDYEFFPMVRGRLIKINDENVSEKKFSSFRARRLVNREMNISYGDKIPKHNVVIKGSNFYEGKGEISVELDIANTLELDLNDKLIFDIDGTNVGLTVTSFRGVKWESMKVNFFMFASRKELIDKPQSYITSFHLEENKKFTERKYDFSFKDQLLDKFPNITVVDTSIIVSQVKDLISNGVTLIKFFFVLSILTAFLVLWASLLALKEQKEKEMIILRILGCSKKQMIQAQLLELIFVGVIAGLLGTILSQLVGNLIFNFIFTGIGFNFFPSYLIFGLVAGVLISLLAGFSVLQSIAKGTAITNLRSVP